MAMSATEMVIPAADQCGADLVVAQARFLLKRTPLALAANAMNIAIVGLVMARTEPSAAYQWMALALLITAGRSVLYLRHRQVAISRANVQTYAAAQTVGAGLAGVAWGLGSVWLFPPAASGQMLLAFVVAEMTAGAVATISPRGIRGSW